MTLDIRHLDPILPETLPTLLPVLQAAIAADAPRHPVPVEDWLRFTSGPRVTRHRMAVAAFDDGVPVGYGVLNQEKEANQDLLFGDLWVLPQRRAEVTGPLVAAFRDYGRSRGCKRLVLGFSEFAAAGYEPVFTAEGARVVEREWRSQLDLTAVDRERYEAWAAPSEKNAHHRIEAWTVPTPEHRLASLVLANEAMRDVPTGDLELEHSRRSVDLLRSWEAMVVAAGQREHVIVAVTEDGEIAGFHEMFVIPGFGMADVGNTGVLPEFRGHGLGLRLKAGMVLRLLAQEPQVEVVSTWNDSDNGPMLRVNEAMGYVKAESWSNWQFDL
ncbi:MAG: GNAT family N-acetyltransferase [Catenulispora sp.]|nr:GNAT family N-acetyltransferase [Catenulispora sp.]